MFHVRTTAGKKFVVNTGQKCGETASCRSSIGAELLFHMWKRSALLPRREIKEKLQGVMCGLWKICWTFIHMFSRLVDPRYRWANSPLGPLLWQPCCSWWTSYSTKSFSMSTTYQSPSTDARWALVVWNHILLALSYFPRVVLCQFYPICSFPRTSVIGLAMELSNQSQQKVKPLVL